ncbi:hypothetical protein CPC08DRAFT_774315 [Agrocybe pediades]|nr:hypothetical protein CPC08DRAFT_774315 [Agrocybe pediades]
MASHNDRWTVQYDKNWDVLGPFPVHAREQHFISPAYPLDLSRSLDYNESWPSAYADNGTVKWTRAISDENGRLNITFPDIRWSHLRLTEGWAALQHHALLRTTLTLHPPANSSVSRAIPQLLVNIKQGSYFTLRPRFGDVQSFTPVWYAGNIYDIERALAHVVDFPAPPSFDTPSEYDLYISGDYEIRLFGDPRSYQSEVPIQSLTIDIHVKEDDLPFVHVKPLDVPVEFMSGYAFGDALGIGLQSAAEWWTVAGVNLKSETTLMQDMQLRLKQQISLAPSQARTVSIVISQTKPFHGNSIDVEIVLTANGVTKSLVVAISVNHKTPGTAGRQWIQGSYFFAGYIPSPFLAVLPTSITEDGQHPLPLLTLHGAGVDILGDGFWVTSLPDNGASWILVPTGRTSWVSIFIYASEGFLQGLDWHGPSTQDAWDSLAALIDISNEERRNFPRSWQIKPNSKVVALGHSNGGQGTWYIASRYPDRVVAGGRFVDPYLRAILECSLTADDNDLHISNLSETPVFAIHGGDDKNVPVWHSREAITTLKTWKPSANVTYKEDPGEDHWYPNVFLNPQVQSFLEEAQVIGQNKDDSDFEEFTLTVTIPWQCGSLHGWAIKELIIPGRLARLTVRKLNDSEYSVQTSNVLSFAVPEQKQGCRLLIDNGTRITLTSYGSMHVHRVAPYEWKVMDPVSQISRPSCRLQSILSTPGHLHIVIPNLADNDILSAALRMAHVLNQYHRLEANIVGEEAALNWQHSDSWPSGNFIFVGPPSSKFAQRTLVGSDADSDIRIVNSVPYIKERRFERPDQGMQFGAVSLLFTYPHPAEQKAIALFIIYNSRDALERALRLFPYRTGIAVPDWVVVGERMDRFGVGGIEAAGVWGNNWKLNETMSWFLH